MKKLKWPLAAAVLLSALLVGLSLRQVSFAAAPGSKTKMGAEAMTATIGVEGMTCGACATSVKIVLKKLDGVNGVQVSLDDRKAVVTYDPARVSPAKMVEAIQGSLSYKARVLAPAKAK